MAVLNAILYNDGDNFVGYCLPFGQISTGKTKDDAMADLETCVKNCIYSVEKEPGLALLTDNFDKDFKILFRKVILNPDKYKPIVREIPDYATLHIYDMVDE